MNRQFFSNNHADTSLVMKTANIYLTTYSLVWHISILNYEMWDRQPEFRPTPISCASGFFVNFVRSSQPVMLEIKPHFSFYDSDRHSYSLLPSDVMAQSFEHVTDDRVVVGSNPTEAVWKLWQFPLPHFASVFRKSH